MLELNIEKREGFDQDKQEFIYIRPQKLKLEHSLLSVSKWESKWKVPFISGKERSKEQTLDYIKCMTLNPNEVDPNVYYLLSEDQLKQIANYIDDKKTATTISKKPGSTVNNGRYISSELIYSWMVQLNIPFECQKWHLSRLLALIEILGESSNPQKMTKDEVAAKQYALNMERRAKLKTRG